MLHIYLFTNKNAYKNYLVDQTEPSKCYQQDDKLSYKFLGLLKNVSNTQHEDYNKHHLCFGCTPNSGKYNIHN